MEIKDIKYIIINFLKKIPAILKHIKTLPGAGKYILMSVVLTLVFLIFTFPYDAMVRNRIQTIGENIGRSISIGRIDFGLLTSTDIDNLSITLKDGSELSLQGVNLDMGLLSAFIRKSASGSIRINSIKYEKDKMSLNIVARSDFNLKFDSQSEFPANGRIKLAFQNIIANGISVKDFDIPPVKFTSIDADLNISRKKITIDNCVFSGPDLKGSIYGYIIPAKFFQQSQMNFNIVVDSTSSFLENYKILLTKWIDSANKIQLVIRGSISNPRVEPLEQKNDSAARMDANKFERRPPAINSQVKTKPGNTVSALPPEMNLHSPPESPVEPQE